MRLGIVVVLALVVVAGLSVYHSEQGPLAPSCPPVCDVIQQEIPPGVAFAPDAQIARDDGPAKISRQGTSPGSKSQAEIEREADRARDLLRAELSARVGAPDISPGGGERPSFSALAERPSAEEEAIKAAIEARERPAKSIIEVNKVMRPRQPYTVRLLLERGKGAIIEEDAKRTPEPSTAKNIRVASDVRASAFGNKGMKVSLLSKEEWQTLLPGKPARWTWQVEAPSVGQYQLTIDLHQKVLVGKAVKIVQVESFPRLIDVSVGWWEEKMSILGELIGVATDTADRLTKFLLAIVALPWAAAAAFALLRRRTAA